MQTTLGRTSTRPCPGYIHTALCTRRHPHLTCVRCYVHVRLITIPGAAKGEDIKRSVVGGAFCILPMPPMLGERVWATCLAICSLMSCCPNLAMCPWPLRALYLAWWFTDIFVVDGLCSQVPACSAPYNRFSRANKDSPLLAYGFTLP